MKSTSKYEMIHHILSELKQPAYRFQQIADAIFKQRIGEYDRMTMLPKGIRNELIKNLGEHVLNLTPVMQQTSRQVNKVLFSIEGGNHIEAVQLSYERGWKSYCISSQCGCGYGCNFCATGTIGLKRNLTTDEITEQLLYFHLNGQALNSVSFMGMGEALANPTIFDTQFSQVNLTFSLHSPFDEQRSELMPINNRFPLKDVLNKLDQHIRDTGRKVYIAYILLRGENDSNEHAKAIAALLKHRGSWEHLYHVNLIPYNSTDVAPENFHQSDKDRVQKFASILKSKGIKVTVRTQFGTDIDAACGQLYGKKLQI
ncbi:23S rRNA (adenine(2503)-C(8))-methyltransferase ClbB [Paenibacillus sp. GCM10023248]|uniref:23S rRNA (adenine(2503)-C(8))-methyltransferase ClbB n=1 Tax=unclassified Paenibacillus TaxID=185978 RepID=UPI0023796248|nr:23S rRNA (adenine(2503)-C(8))-methyltransferase ClbB [Paenibacillus sp. MAHUQ-63]MDD9271921.1 23S rRNA (adenine(2503)-C(8))-methyltransferase ClbB [Paenibacillus sp. MAHUQ-63]